MAPVLHTHDALGHEIKPNSSAHWNLRLGVATASNFHRILTEKTRKLSTSSKEYAVELLLEKELGHPLDQSYDPADKWKDAPTGGRVFNSWTERGTVLENEARTLYMLQRDVDVDRVAFVTTDDGAFGYSPDGLVGTDGTLEIKCRALKGYTERVLGLKNLAKDTQVQGGLWVTEREWCDVELYMPHEAFPTYVERHWRNDKYIAALEKAAKQFEELKERFRAQLDTLGSGVWFEKGDNLEALLKASLIITGDAPEGEMSEEEIAEFSAAVQAAMDAGILDASDRRQIVADIDARDWESCRSMWSYIRRHNLEAV